MFHRDLKPKNILANSDCKLKVCDFGLARPSFNDMPTTIFWTDYVATRWYRAPELCGSFFAKYSPAIDIWSIGCIFAEILQGKPLFPGRNVVHQLELITDLLGTPSQEVIDKVSDGRLAGVGSYQRHLWCDVADAVRAAPVLQYVPVSHPALWYWPRTTHRHWNCQLMASGASRVRWAHLFGAPCLCLFCYGVHALANSIPVLLPLCCPLQLLAQLINLRLLADPAPCCKAHVPHTELSAYVACPGAQ